MGEQTYTYRKDMTDEDIRDSLMYIETRLPVMFQRIIALEKEVKTLQDQVHEIGEGRI